PILSFSNIFKSRGPADYLTGVRISEYKDFGLTTLAAASKRGRVFNLNVRTIQSSVHSEFHLQA
ncbi:MAG: hypothetical protein ACSHYA_18270, partial [Opitutaceae bacterium]